MSTDATTTDSSGTDSSGTGAPVDERADLLASLTRHRWFVTSTLRGLSEEQARRRPTVSALSLGGLLAEYAAVAARTDELVRTLPDLGAAQALPAAPWFEPGARWSARRVLLHVIAETAQHAGHADVLRESVDGQKTTG